MGETVNGSPFLVPSSSNFLNHNIFSKLSRGESGGGG